MADMTPQEALAALHQVYNAYVMNPRIVIRGLADNPNADLRCKPWSVQPQLLIP